VGAAPPGAVPTTGLHHLVEYVVAPNVAERDHITVFPPSLPGKEQA